MAIKGRKKTKPKRRNKREPSPGLQKRTSMWLGEELLKASAERAAQLGISRSLYFQQLLRRDLGLPAALTEGPDGASVFG